VCRRVRGAIAMLASRVLIVVVHANLSHFPVEETALPQRLSLVCQVGSSKGKTVSRRDHVGNSVKPTSDKLSLSQSLDVTKEEYATNNVGCAAT